MTVYVDKAFIPYAGMRMCHMVSKDLGELHAVARKLGLKREWFQGAHYDICLSKRKQAISKHGVKEIESRKQLVEIIRHHRRKNEEKKTKR